MNPITKTITTSKYEITYTKTANKIHFDSVYVEPKFRGHGLAKKKIFEIAEKEGGFYLTLDATGKSRKILRKVGFVFNRGSYFGTMRTPEKIKRKPCKAIDKDVNLDCINIAPIIAKALMDRRELNRDINRFVTSSSNKRWIKRYSKNLV